MSLPPTGSPASDTSLLDEHGQPCGVKIAAEVERQMRPYLSQGRVMCAKRRALKREVVSAQAAEQAAKFGKSADEVRLIDLKAEEVALDYAGHIDRDQRASERQAIRDERREIERRRIEDHLRATLTHPASKAVSYPAVDTTVRREDLHYIEGEAA